MSDLISRQAAIEAFRKELCTTDVHREYAIGFEGVKRILTAVPSAQPEYYDYSDIDDVWEFYAEEQDINLTDGAKQLKDAMWVGYRKGKQDAQPEIIRCRDCKHWLPHERFGFDEDNEEYHDYCARLIPEDEYYAFYRDADEWCSRAERREK